MADRASGLLSRRVHLLDLSMVPILDRLDPDQPKGSLLVPAALDKVLREEVSDPDLRRLMASLVPTVPDAPVVELQDGSSETPRGLVGRTFGTMLSYSKRSGAAMLSSGRLLTSRIRGKLSLVELPDQLTALKKKKEALSNRLLLKTEGVKTAKWVLSGGLVVAAVGDRRPGRRLRGETSRGPVSPRRRWQPGRLSPLPGRSLRREPARLPTGRTGRHRRRRRTRPTL